jgi:hypothetical protein
MTALKACAHIGLDKSGMMHFHPTEPIRLVSANDPNGAKPADFSKRSERDLRLRFTVLGG